ncbi:hypothetical protein LCL87_09760 [Rhodococcus hoagii]|nr:hypothetical protein [Prescottella equi]
MTEPEGDSQAISVAELLARNGQRVGAGGGGRRRRGVKGGISVAELTGEFQAVRAATSETPESESETEAEAPVSEAPAEAPAVEAPAAEAKPAPTPDVDATAAFSLADADAADKADAEEVTAPKPVDAKPAAPKPVDAKPAAEKPAPKADVKPVDAKPVDAKPVDAKPVDDAPTLITRAVEADDRKAADRTFDSGWRSAATTVLEPVPAKSLAHSVEPEPRLLSGQSVAGDLLRRDGDAAPAQDDFVAADADLDDESPADPEDLPDEPSAAKQWAVLLGQGAVAVVAGALMFKGFEKLWDMLPMVALILAVLVIVGLVAMVRILRRTDDITSLVIAVVAGVFVTLGPLAFLLSTS